MPDLSLSGWQILVVEDEYLLADDLQGSLSQAGAKVVGPAPGVEEATMLMGATAHIDAAILDINLKGEMVFPVADLLRERGVPFVFATGYDAWAVPARFAEVPRVEKPLKGRNIVAALTPLLPQRADAGPTA